MTKPVEALNALWQFSSALVEKQGMNGSNTLTDAEHRQWQEVAGLCHEALTMAATDRNTPAAMFLQSVAELNIWGYGKDEAFSPEDLIGEPYQGIRPAPGYPAQPDHTEKVTLFRLLDAEEQAGVSLTESMAMWPGSSVSGIYLSHPESYYFGVAKVERDQVEDYAARKGMDVTEVERWLGPILNYVPASYAEAAE